ncbi:MAG: response regulator [Anaerolineae bacterium]|nr:response regulator [Anaerolineae bacterium]
MTWLIVEDEEDIRNIVQFMAKVWGHDSIVFPDGTRAVHWLEEVDEGTYEGDLPELALLDIRMPGYTGDEVAARIRRSPALEQIAIVMMTAFSLSETEYSRVMVTGGADHLIYKPLPDMDELHYALIRILEEKRAVGQQHKGA